MSVYHVGDSSISTWPPRLPLPALPALPVSPPSSLETSVINHQSPAGKNCRADDLQGQEGLVLSTEKGERVSRESKPMESALLINHPRACHRPRVLMCDLAELQATCTRDCMIAFTV